MPRPRRSTTRWIKETQTRARKDIKPNIYTKYYSLRNPQGQLQLRTCLNIIFTIEKAVRSAGAGSAAVRRRLWQPAPASVPAQRGHQSKREENPGAAELGGIVTLPLGCSSSRKNARLASWRHSAFFMFSCSINMRNQAHLAYSKWFCCTYKSQRF